MTFSHIGQGELYALASPVCWAIAITLYKQSGESMGPFTLNLVKNLIGLALLTPTLLLLSGPTPPQLSPQEWLICLLSGLIGLAAADTLYFACLYRIGAGRTGIVAAMFSPSIIGLSALFLGERLAPLQFAGFFLVLGGVLLVARGGRSEVAPTQLISGVSLGLLSVFLMAVGIVMVKRILEAHDVLWIVQIRLFAGLAGMLVVMVLTRRSARVMTQLRQPHRWGQIALASFFGSYLSMIFWQAGYKYTLASIASVLNESASVFIVLLAWAFLGEPLNGRKLGGVALTFSGVVVMLSFAP